MNNYKYAIKNEFEAKAIEKSLACVADYDFLRQQFQKYDDFISDIIASESLLFFYNIVKNKYDYLNDPSLSYILSDAKRLIIHRMRSMVFYEITDLNDLDTLIKLKALLVSSSEIRREFINVLDSDVFNEKTVLFMLYIAECEEDLNVARNHVCGIASNSFSSGIIAFHCFPYSVQEGIYCSTFEQIENMYSVYELNKNPLVQYGYPFSIIDQH